MRSLARTRPGDAGRPVDAPVARARTGGTSEPRPARTAVNVRAGRTRLSVLVVDAEPVP